MRSKTPARTDSVIATARVCWKVVASGHAGFLGICASLAIVERLAALASAFAWRTEWFTETLVFLGGVSILHRIAIFRLRARSIATAFERIVSRAASNDADLPSISALPVLEAAHDCVRVVVDLASSLLADVLLLVVGFAVLIRLDATLFVVVALAALAIGTTSFALFARPAIDPFEKYLAVAERIADALDGRAEVLASGASTTFAMRTRTAIDDWQRASLRTTLGQLKAGRWMIAAAGLGVLAIAISRGLEAALLRQTVILVVLAPYALGLMRNVLELSRVRSKLAPLTPFFSPVERQSHIVATTDSRDSIMRWQKVAVTYDDHVVLAGATFAIAEGEIVALSGVNGAGKTTLLRVALDLCPVTSGHFEVAAPDVDTWRRRVRYLPQRPYLLPRRDVRSALLFPAAKLDDHALEACLRRVGLWERLEASTDPFGVLTDSLSAGERQRLALARALAVDADVYVLDEPDANLDAEGIQFVAQLLRSLQSQRKTVVFAAHSEAVLIAATRVLRVVDGMVFEEERMNAQLAARH